MNLNGSSYKRKFMVILSRFNGTYDWHSAKAETKKFLAMHGWILGVYGRTTVSVYYGL